MKQIFLLLTVIAVISCAGRVDNNLGPHETRFLTIDPSKEKMMDAYGSLICNPAYVFIR